MAYSYTQYLPKWRPVKQIQAAIVEFNYSMKYVPIDSGAKAPADRQLLPSLLREGTGCRCRTFPVRYRAFRIYRAIPPLRSERTVHSPGQRNTQHRTLMAAR